MAAMSAASENVLAKKKCIMHVSNPKSGCLSFSEKSWKKFVTCAGRWKVLQSTEEANIVKEAETCLGITLGVGPTSGPTLSSLDSEISPCQDSDYADRRVVAMMNSSCQACRIHCRRGNPGRPPFANIGISYDRGMPTGRWRPQSQWTTTSRLLPGPTVSTTGAGATCRYGRRFGCCYGWRRDVYGRCQPICDRPCVHGTCIGNNQCQCLQGYRGATCNRDVNECSTRPCQHRCMNTMGSYRCYCEEGYTLRDDKNTCMHDRRCESMRCSYGCQERGHYNVMCICPEGLRVASNGYSCLDINECLENPTICPEDKRCHNTYGSHTCLCKQGLSYKYIDGKYRCSDEDECATRRHNCHPDAVCTNRVRGYTCECKEGFAGNGTHCVAIDPRTCSNEPCFPNVSCTNQDVHRNNILQLVPPDSKLIRQFTCGTCPEGFIGNGLTCQKLPPKVVALTSTAPTAAAKIRTRPPTTKPRTASPTTTKAPPTTTVTTAAPRTTTLATTAPPTTTVTTVPPTTVTTTAPPTTTAATTAPPTTTAATTAPPTTVTTAPPTTTVTAPPTTTVTTAPPTTTVTTTAMQTTVTAIPPSKTSAHDKPQGEQPPPSVSTTPRVKEPKTTKPTLRRTTRLTTVTVPTTEPETTTAPTTEPPTTTTQAITTPATTTPTTTPPPTTTILTTTTPPPTTIPPPPSVNVFTVDEQASKALLPEVGIKVMIPDNSINATRLLANTTTGPDGMVKIEIPENTAVIITASTDGFLDTSYVYKFKPDQKNILTIQMTRPIEIEEWSWKSGYYKKLTYGDRQDLAKQYRVEIAPGALDVLEGAHVTMRFNPVDMADKESFEHVPELVAAVPNDQGGYDMEGLEVYAIAETAIYMTDTYAPISVLLPVMIEMPLPEEMTEARHGQQLDAWYFNAESGVWMKAGKGDVEYSRGGVMIWRYGAKHFTWWAVGRTFPETNCVVVQACADPACTERIPNVPVRLTGGDFFFMASKVTDELGQACFHFKRQGRVKIDSPCMGRVKYSQGRGKPSMCPADMNSEIIQTQATNTIDSCANVRLVTRSETQTTCEDPETPATGIFVGSDFSYGGQVTYYCGPNSEMVGDRQRVCLDCGRWGGTTPSCLFPDNNLKNNYVYPSDKPFSRAAAATTTEVATKTFQPSADQPGRRKRKRRRRPRIRRPTGQ